MKFYFKCASFGLALMAINFILLPYLISQPNDYAVWLGIAGIIIEMPIMFIVAKNLLKDVENML